MKPSLAVVAVLWMCWSLALADDAVPLMSMPSAQAEYAISALELPAEPFAAGTWVSPFYVSGAIGCDAHKVQAHAGVGYHLWDGVSVNFEAVGGYADFDAHGGAPGGQTSAFGFDLLARWHLIRGEGWSVYLDGGAGIRVFGPKSFPADGTHFNFTPQAGVGCTIQLDERVHLMAGARLYHVSNAAIDGHGRNPGFDAVQVYLGAMLAW